MKIVDYFIETGVSAGDLSEKVREDIADGWQPYGEPFIDIRREGYCQALMKYE